MTKDQNVIIQIILNQIEVARSLAATELPTGHMVQTVLDGAVSSIKLATNIKDTELKTPPTRTVKESPQEQVVTPVEDEKPTTPVVSEVTLVSAHNTVEVEDKVVENVDNPVGVVGVLGDEDNLGDNLEDMFEDLADIKIAGLDPNDYIQVMEETPADIVELLQNRDEAEDDDNAPQITGVIEKDGAYVEIGDFAAATDKLEETITAIEDELEQAGEEGFPEPEHAMSVQYTRLDGNPLSDEDVETILNHPVSAPLHRLGQLKLDTILPGETVASRVARFEIENPRRSTLVGLALGAVAYRGIKVFPGLGRVEAQGSVNFDVM